MLEKLISGFKSLYNRRDEIKEDLTKKSNKMYSNAKDIALGLYADLETLYDAEGKPAIDKWKAKAEEVLENADKSAKVYGHKFVNNMKELTSAGAVVAEHYIDGFRKPTEEELKHIYTGIGTRCDPTNVLLKRDYDKCLDFHKYAKAHIDDYEFSNYKSIILEDIKTSASGTAKELVEFYNDVLKKGIYGVPVIMDASIIMKKKTAVQKSLM